MFTADRSRTVSLPPLVLGGLRPLHRQMVRNNVHSASFEYLAAGGVLDICVLTGEHGPELKIRSREYGVDVTLGMSTHFRAEPGLDSENYRALCAVLAPGQQPAPAIVTGFLRDAVAQSPAVLSRTQTCAA